MIMKSIEVKGISSIGTERTMNYDYPLLHVENDFEAIKKVMEFADREYTCKYDENHRPIRNTDYKEFVTITSVRVVQW